MASVLPTASRGFQDIRRPAGQMMPLPAPAETSISGTRHLLMVLVEDAFSEGNR
jgi:hypothetical protein